MCQLCLIPEQEEKTVTEWTKESLYDEQIHLEELTHLHGIRKYWHTVQRGKDRQDESSTIPAKSIIQTLLPIVSAEIVSKCDKTTAQRSGIAVKYLRPMNPDILALITLRVLMDGISTPRTLTSIAKAIGT